jgi:hypothetical protein
MSFRDELNEHIEESLSRGILPDPDVVMEMEVPDGQLGPQASGDEGGPKSAPAKTFPWMGTDRPPMFRSAPRAIPPAAFQNQNRIIPPARFGSASSGMHEEAVLAVLADLETLRSEDE